MSIVRAHAHSHFPLPLRGWRTWPAFLLFTIVTLQSRACSAQCELTTFGNALGVAMEDDVMVTESHGINVYRLQGGNWILEQSVDVPHALPTVDVHSDLIGVDDFSAGGVRLYRFDGASWNLESILTPSDQPVDAYFGRGIAIGDDLVVVGAWGRDEKRGGAYIYRLNGSQWEEEAILTDTSAPVGARFGYSVAIQGERVIVGEPLGEPFGENTGMVTSYLYDGATWIPEQVVVPNDATLGSYFGEDISLDGDSLIVGAPTERINGLIVGSAYVYRLSMGQWQLEQKLLPSSLQSFEAFGQSVSLSGNRALVASSGLEVLTGGADLFERTGTSWTRVASLAAPQPEPYSEYGNRIAISGEFGVVEELDSYLAHVISLDLADCNGNGICDFLDIASGTSIDADGDGIPDECEFRRSDANSDGAFDVSDAVTILDYLFEGTTVACRNAMDTNDDERIDVSDAAATLLTLFGVTGPPPAPYPGCGVDPTPGHLSCANEPQCP